MFSRRGPTQAASPPAASPPTGSAPGGRWSRLLLGLLRAVGLMSLAYIAGAAVIYFDLPSSTFLRRALGGAAAWYESRDTEALPDRAPAPVVGGVDRPDRTFDGFTLCM